jgi:ribosomal protein L9
MRQVNLLFVFALLFTVVSLRASTRQQLAQQQQSNQQQQLEQQRREEQQRANEQRQKEEDTRRERMTNSLKVPTPTSVANSASRQVTEPCLAMQMSRDQSFSLQEIPLVEWLTGVESHEIPWKVQVRAPQLRLDQRYEVAYSASSPWQKSDLLVL